MDRKGRWLKWPYIWNGIVAIGKYHGIKEFFPPLVDLASRIVFSQRQFPLALPIVLCGGRPRDVFNSCVRLEQRVRLMQSKVVFDILSRDVMRRKGTVRKQCIRKGHDNVGDVCTEGIRHACECFSLE